MALHLYIGNKNYSSWSMRSWVLLRQAGIAFEEKMLRFDKHPAPNSPFKQSIEKVSPAGRVPVLVDDGFSVWDTLAIAEYLAEKFPQKNLWPQNPAQRARARSVCAEMHSGFTALRSHCPMNIEANLAQAGGLIWRDHPAVRQDMERIQSLWKALLSAHAHQHPQGMLFGSFSIADAFFAPLCMRILAYNLPVDEKVQAYIQRVCSLEAVQAWVSEALAEKDFLDFEEPWRRSREG